MGRAEHKSWPTGFPHSYFLICNMNTYPINMKQPDSESYWWGLSIKDAKIFILTRLVIKHWIYIILAFAMDSPNEMLSEAFFFRIYWISIHGINKEINAWETCGSRLMLSPRYGRSRRKREGRRSSREKRGRRGEVGMKRKEPVRHQ